MKKYVLLAACALAVVILPSATSGGGGPQVFAFHTMYAVDGPFLGPDNAIQGVPGDELPWVVKSAHGFLNEKGTLQIEIKGLVFSDDDKVPVELQGTNDEDEFRALVSCLTEDADGHVLQEQVITKGFKATTSGDCQIHAHIDLPDPCIAPVVFVMAGSEDKWFAVSGVEVGGD